jgi:microcystin-dependent protein
MTVNAAKMAAETGERHAIQWRHLAVRRLEAGIGLYAMIAVALAGVTMLSVTASYMINRHIIIWNQGSAANTKTSASANVTILEQKLVNGSGYLLPPAMVTGSPSPSDGGQLPIGIGLSATDGWGTPYGYCAWNDTGSALTGYLTGTQVNSAAYPIFAIISAGPNRHFNTTCAQIWSGAGQQSDDVVVSVSYAQAANGAPIWTQNSDGSISFGALSGKSVAVNKAEATAGYDMDIAGPAQFASVNVTGAATMGSATVTGPTAMGSANVTGTMTAGAAAVTGATTTGSLASSGMVSGSQLASTITTGTAPLSVISTTPVANLTTTYLGAAGQDAAFFQNASNLSAGTLPIVRLPAFTGDATAAAGTGSLTLANTPVTPGTYSLANITVNNQGRLTAASSGSLTGAQITTALGYTPYSSSNPSSYISGVNAAMVTTALGYTPVNKGGDTMSGALTVSAAVTANTVAPTSGNYVYLNKTTGVPATTPAAVAGAAPIAVDPTGKAIYAYDGAAWQTMGGGSGGGGAVGTVSFFGASTCPSGSIEANGATISRATNASLFSVIGTTFGAGDGSTTFGIPDLRGQFIRGWDHGRGTADSGRAFGSWENMAIQAHSHDNGMGPYGQAGSTSWSWTGGATGQQTGQAGGAETRPVNVALLPCIQTTTSTSDRRMKSDIHDLDVAGDLFDRLQPRRWVWANDPAQSHDVGFVAQELAELIPDAVTQGDQNQARKPGDVGFVPWTVNYPKLIPFLVAETQALRRRVTALELAGKSPRSTDLNGDDALDMRNQMQRLNDEVAELRKARESDLLFLLAILLVVIVVGGGGCAVLMLTDKKVSRP